MYTQFFGNFLLSKGYITNEQLFDALKEKAQKHAKLGTLAIHSGLMTAAECHPSFFPSLQNSISRQVSSSAHPIKSQTADL